MLTYGLGDLRSDSEKLKYERHEFRLAEVLEAITGRFLSDVKEKNRKYSVTDILEEKNNSIDKSQNGARDRYFFVRNKKIIIMTIRESDMAADEDEIDFKPFSIAFDGDEQTCKRFYELFRKFAKSQLTST